MKQLSFRALILGILAPVLVLITGVWGWLVYESIHGTIIGGFDRKLLSITGSVALLMDREGHEAYQQRREVDALCANPSGGLVGLDRLRREWVSIDIETGAAKTIAPINEPLGGQLATDPNSGSIWAIDAAGIRLFEFEPATGRVKRTVPLTERVEGVFSGEKEVFGWRGRHVYKLTLSTGESRDAGFMLPTVPNAVLWEASAKRYLLIADAGKTLVVADASGGYKASYPIRLTTSAGDSVASVKGLARTAEKYFAAGSSLLEIDPTSGRCKAGSYTKSYFDTMHPFYVKYRDPFMFMRKACNLTYLYTSVYVGGMDLYYVLDGTEGANYSSPGATDTIPTMEAVLADLQVQYLGKPYVSKVQQWEQWGLVKTSAYPIQDDTGRTVAIAGADVDMSTIRGKTRWALFSALFVGVCSLAGAVVISVKVSRRLTQPLLALKYRALRIAAGDYLGRTVSNGDGEVSRLGRILDGVSDRLREYQENSQRYRKDLHAVRTHSTLARALDMVVAKTGETERSVGGRGDFVCGQCWSGQKGVVWRASMLQSEVGAASIAARLTVLGRGLLRVSMPSEEIAATLLGVAKEVDAVAVWQANTGPMYYRVRGPAVLSAGGHAYSVEGSGILPVSVGERVSWVIDEKTDEGLENAKGVEAP